MSNTTLETKLVVAGVAGPALHGTAVLAAGIRRPH
jgi:hypothetical protein